MAGWQDTLGYQDTQRVGGIAASQLEAANCHSLTTFSLIKSPLQLPPEEPERGPERVPKEDERD